MPFFDYHIHTKYSRCSRRKGKYSYLDVAQRIPSLGLDGFGTSDHSHNRIYRPNFIKVQKEQQLAHHLEETGLVGLEITILNQKGDLGVDPKFLNGLDYKIISEHVHKLKPYSKFYNAKKRVRKWIAKDYGAYSSKIDQIITDLAELEINAIKRHPRSILAHILSFPLSVRIVPPVLYERLDDVLGALQSAEVALEISSKYIAPYNMSKQDADAWKAAGDDNVRDFFHHLFHRAKDYSLHFALGSDAHRLADILPKQKWEAFLKQLNISESQLITPYFFSD